jgi:hypothetical protein
MKIIIALVCGLCIPTFAHSQQILQQGMGKDTIAITCPLHRDISFTSNAIKNEFAIPQNFYTQHLSFFCRQELKMQEVHVPVTFRLGSMDYCNWLEQKPGYR